MFGNRFQWWKILSISLATAAWLLLAACAPENETTPIQEATQTRPASPALASPTVESAPPTVTASPTATMEAPIELSPTAVPAEIEGAKPIPIDDDPGLTVVEQYGGVPNALAVEGSIAFAGFGPRLLAIDMADPAEPQLLGQSDPLPDIIRGLDVVEGVAYAATGRGGLITLDVSDPAAIEVLSSGPNYAGQDRPSAESVTVAQDTAYLVNFDRQDGSIDLLRFDVTNPEEIAFLDDLALEVNESLIVDDGLIIVVGNGRLQLRDAADPGLILSVTPLASGSYASRAIVFDGRLAIVESGENSIVEQYDISDPSQPLSLPVSDTMEFFFFDQVAMNEEALFIGGTFGEFGHCGSQIIAADMLGERPRSLTTFDPLNCISKMVLDGDTLFVAGRSGLQAYHVSDPANLLLQGTFRHPHGFQDAQSIASYEGVTYILSSEGRSFDLVTLDLSQSEPTILNDRLEIGTGSLLDLIVAGDGLIAPMWMGGLYTLDISDPADPQLLHQPAEGELSAGDLFTVVFNNQALYLPVVGETWVGGVGAIDLTDLANPALANVVETGNAQVLSQALNGDNLYVLSQGESTQIHIFDVSQPLAPQPAGVLTLPQAASRLAVAGTILYAACDQWNCQSLYSIDVGDPLNPAITQEWKLPVGVQDMVVGEPGTLYLVTRSEGIWALDTSDPSEFRLSGPLKLAGDFARVKVLGDKMLAAVYESGAYVIQIDR